MIIDGLLVGIIFMATSLGVLVPVLKDAGEVETAFGRLIMAAGSVAELVPLLLVSVFFSTASSNSGAELRLLAGFVGFTAVAVAVMQRVRKWPRPREVASRLENTSAQLRVRVAITLALAFGVVAADFGLAMILGAFLAGVILRRADQPDRADPAMASSDVLRTKLEAIGFGFLVPVFFVSTGASLDVRSLFHSTGALVAVPVFLVALLVVRGLPALLYAPALGRSRAVAAGFMQSTSLTFVVVATAIGVQTHHLRTSIAAALVVTGLLSVVLYPPMALKLMRQHGPGAERPELHRAPVPNPTRAPRPAAAHRALALSGVRRSSVLVTLRGAHGHRFRRGLARWGWPRMSGRV